MLEKWTEEKVDLKTLVYKTKKEWRSLKNEIFFFLPDSSTDQTRAGVPAAAGEAELGGDTGDPPPGLYVLLLPSSKENIFL